MKTSHNLSQVKSTVQRAGQRCFKRSVRIKTLRTAIREDLIHTLAQTLFVTKCFNHLYSINHFNKKILFSVILFIYAPIEIFQTRGAVHIRGSLNQGGWFLSGTRHCFEIGTLLNRIFFRTLNVRIKMTDQ